jgi:hypothetical protein
MGSFRFWGAVASRERLIRVRLLIDNQGIVSPEVIRGRT